MLFGKTGVSAKDIRSVGRSGPATGHWLATRRRWYADGPADADADGKGTDDGLSPAANQAGSGQGDSGQSDPYAHIKDKNAFIAALEKRLADGKDNSSSTDADELKTLRAFRDTKMREDGNHAALLEVAEARLAELEPSAARLDTLVEGIRGRNKERIAALPEDRRGAAEMLVDNLSPENLSVWLDTAAPLFTQVKPPGTDAGAGGNGVVGGQVSLTVEEQAIAKRHNMTDAEYAKSKAKTVS